MRINTKYTSDLNHPPLSKANSITIWENQINFPRSSHSQWWALVNVPVRLNTKPKLNSPGKMGSAVLSGILANHKTATQAPITKFIACVQTPSSAERLRTTFKDHLDHLTVLHNDNLTAFQQADVILLACKPYLARSILSPDGVREALHGKFLISILAGSSPEKLASFIYPGVLLESAAGHRCHITRATPNMAASLGSSMTLIETATPALPPELAGVAEWIFGQVGGVKYVAPDVFDVGSAVTGAGIAFLTVAVDGMLDGAVAEGVKRGEAREMVAQTLRGMADLLAAGNHPAVLREEISSPRGTTIRGLLALEEGRVRASFSKAVMEATERAREL
jgi:pyrroline-5-carboxylate reductase